MNRFVDSLEKSLTETGAAETKEQTTTQHKGKRDGKGVPRGKQGASHGVHLPHVHVRASVAEAVANAEIEQVVSKLSSKKAASLLFLATGAGVCVCCVRVLRLFILLVHPSSHTNTRTKHRWDFSVALSARSSSVAVSRAAIDGGHARRARGQASRPATRYEARITAVSRASTTCLRFDSFCVSSVLLRLIMMFDCFVVVARRPSARRAAGLSEEPRTRRARHRRRMGLGCFCVFEFVSQPSLSSMH